MSLLLFVYETKRVIKERRANKKMKVKSWRSRSHRMKSGGITSSHGREMNQFDVPATPARESG